MLKPSHGLSKKKPHLGHSRPKPRPFQSQNDVSAKSWPPQKKPRRGQPKIQPRPPEEEAAPRSAQPKPAFPSTSTEDKHQTRAARTSSEDEHQARAARTSTKDEQRGRAPSTSSEDEHQGRTARRSTEEEPIMDRAPSRSGKIFQGRRHRGEGSVTVTGIKRSTPTKEAKTEGKKAKIRTSAVEGGGRHRCTGSDRTESTRSTHASQD